MKYKFQFKLVLGLLLLLRCSVSFAMSDAAATSINALGLDLLKQTSASSNSVLLSPYSIQCAMAMAYAGAEAETKQEMGRVLHYPENLDIHASMAELQKGLQTLVEKSQVAAEKSKQSAPRDPLMLSTANRMYGQQGYNFRPAFLNLLAKTYLAPFEAVDFVHRAPAITAQINSWVESQTKERIKNLIPPGALNELSRLILVNAIYFKAPWEKAFTPSSTLSEPFHLLDGKSIPVPTMVNQQSFGYADYPNCTAISLPYAGNEITFLILLPKSGVGVLEKSLSLTFLNECARLPNREIRLHLPKFKLEPPTLALGTQLKSLGMRHAFDEPRGTANFNGIAPKLPTDYLYISDVFHKAFIEVDEKGTEAAAATAVHFATRSAVIIRDPPLEVRIDQPFLFAIQHRNSGACLFLGRLVDPR